MMKLLLKLQREKDCEMEQVCQSDSNNNVEDSIPSPLDSDPSNSESPQRTFDKLLDHYLEIGKDPDRMELIRRIYQELFKYDLKELPEDFDQFGRICGKVLINSFNYTISGGLRVGTALYLEASALNHSCIPNAGFSFQSGNVLIRALEPIETQGSPLEDVITISYIDLLDCTKNRQANLMERYYFDCDCERCRHPELEQTMYSIRCQGVKCSGRPVYVGVGENLDDLDVHPCSACGKKPIPKILGQYLQICRNVQEVAEDPSPPLDAKSSDECMSLMTGLFHPDHYLYMKMAKKSFDEHYSRQEWDLAREYGLLCLNSYRKYKHHVWPSLAQILVKLGTLEFLHMKKELPQKVAHTHLNEALEILELTHGQDHELYYQAQRLWQESKLY